MYGYFNDQGAKLIDAGLPQQAIHVLAKALKSSRLSISSHNHKASTTSIHIQDRLDAMMGHGMVPQTDDGQLANASIYKQPIFLQSGSTFYYEDLNMVVIANAVIIFNLALAHHLAGIMLEQQRTTRRSLFCKALKLYEATDSLLRSNIVDLSGRSLLLALAVVNNMGHLCKDLNQETQAQEYFN